MALSWIELLHLKDVMHKKSYKEQETEKQKGKRRYIERRVQDEEAEKEIREYEDSTDERGVDRFDGFGPLDGECSAGKLR